MVQSNLGFVDIQSGSSRTVNNSASISNETARGGTHDFSPVHGVYGDEIVPAPVDGIFVDGDVSVEFDGVRVACEKVRPARAWGWSMQCVNTTGRTPHCAGQVRCHNGSDFTVE